MWLLIKNLQRSRVFRGVSSNMYVQLTQIFSQVALVPVMATYWGLTTYGVWLLLFSIPGYLALTDLGISRAATADMIGYVARNQHDEAVGTYRAARVLTLAASGTGLLLVISLSFTLFYQDLNENYAIVGHDVAVVLSLLALYGVITLQNGVTNAAYTASGAYALSGYIAGTMFAVETLAAIIIVASGGGIAAVALSYVVIRSLGTGVFSLIARRVAPWLFTGHSVLWRDHVSQLVRPALALVFGSVAQAVSIQGTVAAVGFVAGAAMVPIFTTVRTLSRIAIQAIMIVNHAIMPSFSVAMATDDRDKTRELMTTSVLVTLICSTAVLVPAVLLGPWFIEFWTNGAVRPTSGILIAMAGAAFINTLWTPISNLIMAINLQERFAYAYLAASLAGILICFPLTSAFGATGAAISVLVVDLFMLLWIVPLARKLGVLNLRDLVHDIPRVLQRVTAFARNG
jgi:O-antigen/teichoic acid export membrane protein